MATIKVGDRAAPAGKKLLLSFHPLAPTGVCAEKDDQVTS